MNAAKCELIAHPDFLMNDTLLQLFKRVEVSNSTLLGAHLLPGSALDDAWAMQCQELIRVVDRLDAIGSQDGLIF